MKTDDRKAPSLNAEDRRAFLDRAAKVAAVAPAAALLLAASTRPSAAQGIPTSSNNPTGDLLGDNINTSDARLKEDIQRIGTTAHGLPLYRFRYLGQPEIHEGVMAQDVLNVMPQAVIAGEDGMLKVNYALLGIPFRRLH